MAEDAVQVKFTEVDRRLEEHAGVHKEIWKDIKGIRNRPPFTAVLIITGLFGLVTALLTAMFT